MLGRLHNIFPAQDLEGAERPEVPDRPAFCTVPYHRRRRPGGNLSRTDGNDNRRYGVLVRESGLGVHGTRTILSADPAGRVQPVDIHNLPRCETVADKKEYLVGSLMASLRQRNHGHVLVLRPPCATRDEFRHFGLLALDGRSYVG